MYKLTSSMIGLMLLKLSEKNEKHQKYASVHADIF